MKNKNICDFVDILYCAEKLGYSWSQAHDILVKSDICAMYGAQDIHKSEINEECIPDEDTRKILLAFFEQEKVDEFQINPKGG